MTSRLLYGLAFASYAAFAAWCVHAAPPSVDLPAHAAQLQTLAELLRGNDVVVRYYEATFPLGYGLTTWLFVPLALLWNGAVAAKVALFGALLLLPVSFVVLAATFGRPPWLAVFAFPYAFNISYWYGFLPTLWALPFALLSIAAFIRARRAQRPLWWTFAFAAAATVTLLFHIVVFAALCVVIAALVLGTDRTWRGVVTAGAGLALPLAVSAARVLVLAQRAVNPGDHLPTRFAFDSRFNWLWKAYVPEGRSAVLVPVILTLVFVTFAVRHRRTEPKEPWWVFGALCVLFLVTPRAISGAWLIDIRLPSLVGVTALLLVRPEVMPRWVRGLLAMLVLASLVETARFHHRFRAETEGLEEITRAPTPAAGVHGYLSLAGERISGSRLPYLEHLGQWWTARQGGVGHHFFADVDHQPVRFANGTRLPMRLEASADLEIFDALVLFGDGPVPAGFVEVERSGNWRRVDRR